MATTAAPQIRRFASPFELQVPAGCEGWEELYPYYALFRPEQREAEEARGWFRDGMHFPEPMYPFDFVTADSPYLALGQANSRIFVVPPALGIDHRVLFGWVYMSANAVTDPAEVGRRAELFGRRAGFYFQHWDELYARWLSKVQETIGDLEALEVPGLPEVEHEAVVTEGRGVGSSHTLLVAYHRLLESIDRIWQYHFEFLNLGYAAYLVFYELCKQHFPDIADQTIAKMLAGVDVVLFRPDTELKRLAAHALEAGIASAVKSSSDEQQLRAALAGSEAGDAWLVDWDTAKTPWFSFSNGNGFYHHHRSWIDDLSVPLAHLRGYIERLEAGEEIERPLAAVSAERERITAEYRALLDGDAVEAFDQNLGLARLVFPYVESHNFYVEHWYHTVFWNKAREFGTLLADHGVLDETDDIFYLRRHEVLDALVDTRLAWAAGSRPRGAGYWRPIVVRRKEIMEAMRAFSPPSALGAVPEAITEPMTIMLWGITTERVRAWAGAGAGDGGRTLTGFAGSGGVVEGRARVVHRIEQLGELEQGEILVAAVTSPSWTPVFGKIAAAVSDIGGIMSHAAIVAREYRLPAVVGAGDATSRIRTGDRLRVDGDAGTVTIL